VADLPTVGFVVVSHSAPLARAAVDLAREMLHSSDVRVEVAAGLDEDTFGTDAMKIHDALLAADSGAGVVVLMDLGSALLSTELALDLLDDDARSRVLLCPAPLVEGLVVGVVAAAGGASREAVAAEAAGGLAGKQAHLAHHGPGSAAGGGSGGPVAEAGSNVADAVVGMVGGPVDGGPVDGAGAVTASFVVTTPHGLHARPAARLVQEIAGFDASVTLRNVTTGAGPVAASSLSRVATLGARHGQEVEIGATGPQARAAVDHVLALAGRAFDEGAAPPEARPDAPAVPTRAPSARDGVGQGMGRPTPGAPLPGAPGVGVGPVWSLGAVTVEVPDSRTADPAADRVALDEAIATVSRSVAGLRERTAHELGEGEAAIFDAHRLLLADADLVQDAARRITGGLAAAPAWAAAIARVEAEFAALSDSYLRARAADVRAVGDQVLRELLGLPSVAASGEGVLVAPDLTPAEAAELDPARVVAVVLAHGSPTAHAVILARGKGIPMVVAVGEAVLAVPDGTLVAVDGGTGEVVVDPAPDVAERFRARRASLETARAGALARAAEPAATADGHRVLVGANLGSRDDAVAAAASGADLAGLVRTEFLFLGRNSAPDVDEQVASYLAVAEALGGRRMTLRTLDVGGDKPLSYVATPYEANPFLGVRGLRLSLGYPGLFADQVLAVVRTAHLAPVSVMFPMVTTVAEVRQARAMLDEAVAKEGRGVPAGLQVGIMVEVPATALKTAAFAPLVDFFSIGTNDLTQYATAAERGNADVAGLGDACDPGVLRLVQAVCDGAGGALVAICGELAADVAAVPLLVGLGVGELSVSPGAVPQVKEAVRGVDRGEARDLVRRALAAEGPEAVRVLLG
jgi:phosphocarrier protein FPr